MDFVGKMVCLWFLPYNGWASPSIHVCGVSGNKRFRFYKHYWFSEWDADISNKETDLNSSAQVIISQGHKIRGFGLIGLIDSK